MRGCHGPSRHAAADAVLHAGAAAPAVGLRATSDAAMRTALKNKRLRCGHGFPREWRRTQANVNVLSILSYPRERTQRQLTLRAATRENTRENTRAGRTFHRRVILVQLVRKVRVCIREAWLRLDGALQRVHDGGISAAGLSRAPPWVLIDLGEALRHPAPRLQGEDGRETRVAHASVRAR